MRRGSTARQVERGYSACKAVCSTHFQWPWHSLVRSTVGCVVVWGVRAPRMYPCTHDETHTANNVRQPPCGAPKILYTRKWLVSCHLRPPKSRMCCIGRTGVRCNSGADAGARCGGCGTRACIHGNAQLVPGVRFMLFYVSMTILSCWRGFLAASLPKSGRWVVGGKGFRSGSFFPECQLGTR